MLSAEDRRRLLVTKPLPQYYAGQGKIYRGDKEIATVDYSVRVDSSALNDVRGQIAVLRGEWNLISDDLLVLHLGEGFRFEFVPIGQSGTPPRVTFRISAAGRGFVTDIAS